jgi:hypothetical protein
MASVDWLSGIMAGIATSLKTVPALGNHVFAYTPDSLPSPPYAIVGFPELIEFDFTMGGGNADMQIPVRIYVAKVDERGGQLKLHAMMDPRGAGSINDAIESDPTLGGVCDTLHCEKAWRFGVYQVGQAQLLGVEFLVRVISQSQN